MDYTVGKLPCPFCGEKAQHNKDYLGSHAIGCSNAEECPVLPMVTGDSEEECWEGWQKYRMDKQKRNMDTANSSDHRRVCLDPF